MITDSIIKMFALLYNFVLNLLPRFSIIDKLINVKEGIIDFFYDYMVYVLYFFNVPVLVMALGLLVSYIGFLAIEYLVKLGIKYFTNVV